MGGMASSFSEFLDRLVADFFRHARGIDFLFEFVEFAFFAAAEFLLDGFDLLVEVILFLRFFHLPLDARLDGAVHVELFDLDVEHVADAVQAFGGIEISSNPCFSSMESCRLAAMVSVSFAGSSMRTAAIMVS